MNARQILATVIPDSLLRRAVPLRSLGFDSVAWAYPDVLAVAKRLADHGCVVLGVDVIEVCDRQRLRPTYDSAYCSQPHRDDESEGQSYKETADYIQSYVQKNGNIALAGYEQRIPFAVLSLEPCNSFSGNVSTAIDFGLNASDGIADSVPFGIITDLLQIENFGIDLGCLLTYGTGYKVALNDMIRM
jgi:hypothetical protein